MTFDEGASGQDTFDRVWTSIQGERPHLLLLIEARRRGLRDASAGSVSQNVLHELVNDDEKLLDRLETFAVSKSLVYARLAFDVIEHRSEMKRFGVRWLPQIRVVRAGKTLMRAGMVWKESNILACHVGGTSFLAPPDGNLSLFNVLSHAVRRWSP